MPHPPKTALPATYETTGKLFFADSCRTLVAAAESGSVRLRAFGRAGYPGKPLPDEALPGLRSVGCWDAANPQNWGLPRHRNEGIEISFLASGEISARIGHRFEPLRHDQFLITRPWQPHQLGNPHIGPSRLIWLILDVDVRRPHQEWHWPSWIILTPEDLQELTRCLRQNEQFIWPGSPDIRRCFLAIARALETDHSTCDASRLAVLINDVLLAVLDHFRQIQIPLRESLTSTERTLQQFILEMSASPGEPWTLQSMAQSCNLGVTRFVELFRQATNLSPSNYLTQIRIHQAAKLLLSHPKRPITDIALECGFSSSQYFANVFTRKMRRSPRAFRKSGR